MWYSSRSRGPVLVDSTHFVAAADNERQKAEPKQGMVQGGTKVLPEGNMSAGVVGREQQSYHVHQAENTRDSYQNSEYERQPNRQLPIRDQKGYRRGMG